VARPKQKPRATANRKRTARATTRTTIKRTARTKQPASAKHPTARRGVASAQIKRARQPAPPRPDESIGTFQDELIALGYTIPAKDLVETTPGSTEPSDDSHV
jgi:hypothetical protein